MHRVVSLLTLVAAGALSLGALSACTGAERVATRAEYEARLARNPRDGEAARELGAALAREGQTAGARDALELAVAIRPGDGKALYLLALTTETLGGDAEAVYARYGQLAPADVYRDSLRARLDGLVRTRLRTEFAASLAAEDTLDGVPATTDGSGAVAVLPFAYRGADAAYAPLGRGLAEVLSVDLAAVPTLTVVERVRLEALLAEFALAREGRLDAATAPAAGRLLRAGRLVGGEYDVRDDARSLRIDAAVWTGDSLAAGTAEGGLADLFRLQGEVARDVLAALGIGGAAEVQLPGAPTEDIEAFLLFSRGLVAEDAGDPRAARALYASAATRDPGFALAAARRDAAALSAAVAGPASAVLVSAARAAAPPGLDLVASRADDMTSALRGRLGPNSDSREAVVEGSAAGILGSLPDPPDPPSPPDTGGK